MGLSSPLPCPQTARPSGCKGARNAREPATNPCSATGASGSHLRSFASHAKLGKAGANGKSGRKAGTIRGPNHPDMCTRFPLSKDRARFPRYRGRSRIRPELTLGSGGQSEIRDGAAKNCKPTMPSGGSPLAVLGVNLGHENGSERELSLPCLPRQFAQIAAR